MARHAMTLKGVIKMKHLLLAALLMTAFSTQSAPVEWTQQPGTFHWYKSGTSNKYPTTNPLEFTIPSSWVKQDDNLYIQCRSTGGAYRYYQQGLDCYGQKPIVNCDAFMCVNNRGELVFDLSKNTVLACPKVKVTKEQLVMIYEGKQHNVPACN